MPRFEKRHYIAIAELLHANPNKGVRALLDSNPNLTRSQRTALLDCLSVADLCRAFSADNENFDRQRFMLAVDTGKIVGRAIRGGPAMDYYKWGNRLMRR